MDNPVVKIREFVAFVRQHLTGDEKGEAQICRCRATRPDAAGLSAFFDIICCTSPLVRPEYNPIWSTGLLPADRGLTHPDRSQGGPSQPSRMPL